MTLLGCGVLDFHHDTDAVLILARGHLRDAVACVALHVVVDAVHVVYWNELGQDYWQPGFSYPPLIAQHSGRIGVHVTTQDHVLV